MATVDVLHALLPEDEEGAAIRDLELHGLYATEIAVQRPAPGRYELADETLHRDVLGTRRGALVGAVVGFALGIVVGLAFPGVGDEGFDRLLMSAVAVAGFGALVGAMIGLQGGDVPDDDPVRWRELSSDDPVCCLTVRCEHRRNVAHRILERHGADFLESDRPV